MTNSGFKLKTHERPAISFGHVISLVLTVTQDDLSLIGALTLLDPYLLVQQYYLQPHLSPCEIPPNKDHILVILYTVVE
jgi:hypothetical protein